MVVWRLRICLANAGHGSSELLFGELRSHMPGHGATNSTRHSFEPGRHSWRARCAGMTISRVTTKTRHSQIKERK